MDSNISQNSQNRPLMKYSMHLLLSIVGLSFLAIPTFAEEAQVILEESSEINANIASHDEMEDDHEKAVLNAVVEQLAKNEDEITSSNEVDGSDTANSPDHENDWMDGFDQEVVDNDNDAEDKNEAENADGVDGTLVAEKNRIVVKKKKNQSRNKMTEGEILTADFILNTSLNNEKPNSNLNTQSGWVYLGRFASKGWFNKTLDIKKSLPRVGTSYTVMQSLNMRSEPPAKQGTAQLIKNLKVDDSVKVLEVRRSGRNGHYWAQVELQ